MSPKKTIQNNSVYRSLNGSPAENIRKVIELMGGIDSIINQDDIVIIKPNAQWWSHGATNLLAIQTLIEIIMNRKEGFSGEIVLGENCHRGPQPWMSSQSAWAGVFKRNSDISGIINLNGLTTDLKQRYGNQFTVGHWLDTDAGGRQLTGADQSPGYVYCNGKSSNPLFACENDLTGDKHRATIMTYPIFTTDNDTIVDLKNGCGTRGRLSQHKLKWINFSALNHHSPYCGVTAVIKNIYGVVDLSGGADPAVHGILDPPYYNFHAFAFNEWQAGPQTGIAGRAVGTFMKTIRKPDLNIISAEWVGLASRIDLPAAFTNTVLASRNPVALDYHAVKHILYPNSRIRFHDQDNANNALFHDLHECTNAISCMSFKEHITISYDFKSNQIQENNPLDLDIVGKMIVGKSIKGLLKYSLYRLSN